MSVPLPCPFCGGKALITEDDSYGGCGVGCNCEAEPYVQRDIGKLDDAIRAWNIRTLNEMVKGRIPPRTDEGG